MIAGQSDHSAGVRLDMGISAVVGCGDATMRPRTGN
jgi:hypothetical protein